ncbi:MMPL family transporter [Jatrophihabitans sp.]|uniref:MMPL family transporter n=1 Tax=Jatrophihabitans sp. TaxID=1932789 RepID=UPI002CC6FF00|nr:MMPL family transporter [Jatrophihabitans sp.]
MTDVRTPPAAAPAPGRPRQLPRGLPVFTVLAVAILAFLAGGAGGSYQGKLPEVEKNDNSSWLPGSAESTKVLGESAKFIKIENVPGFMVFHRPSGLTDADRAAASKAAEIVARTPGIDTDALTPPQTSSDGTTIAVFTPLVAKQDGKAVRFDKIAKLEQQVVDATTVGLPEGLKAYPAGQAGLFLAFSDAFAGIDGALLFAALGVVILILLFVYRSPVLWIFPILSAVLALGLSSLVIYYLAKNDVVTLNGQSAGIMPVLVLGAGTDYALLLISRYREELHTYPNRFDAMIKAWRRSAPAIVASAATVILGLLCLSFSSLASDKSLGPVGAISIACTLILAMSFLPVALALAGRWVFWPRKPKADQMVDLASHGFWARVATKVDSNRRTAWIGVGLVLGICLLGLGTLKAQGLDTAQGFTNTPDAVVGQDLYLAKFARDTSTPAVIATNAGSVEAVIAAASKVAGVDTKPGAVCIQVDYPKLAAAVKSGAALPGEGCAPESLQVQPIDGRTIVNVTLADPFDSREAYATVGRLRDAVHGVAGADARVGGASAATLDVQDASVHDRNLIIPIVLLVIFLVLAVLLRAIVAPVLLILTVVLSFGAALGLSAIAFNHLFHFAGADPSFPLFTFVFLVALGIDYNIFLMTRIREESVRHGTRVGISRGLTVTGGVITSAGLVLAATFAVLGVLPIVFLAELGFAVAVGVLMDTILVRSILVPALAADIGKRIWWPSKLAHGAD